MQDCIKSISIQFFCEIWVKRVGFSSSILTDWNVLRVQNYWMTKGFVRKVSKKQSLQQLSYCLDTITGKRQMLLEVKKCFIFLYPTSGLDHLELQRVSERLTMQQCNSVTAGKAWEHEPWGKVSGLWDQLWETSRSPFHHSPHVQPLLCQSSSLGK